MSKRSKSRQAKVTAVSDQLDPVPLKDSPLYSGNLYSGPEISKLKPSLPVTSTLAESFQTDLLNITARFSKFSDKISNEAELFKALEKRYDELANKSYIDAYLEIVEQDGRVLHDPEPEKFLLGHILGEMKRINTAMLLCHQRMLLKKKAEQASKETIKESGAINNETTNKE